MRILVAGFVADHGQLPAREARACWRVSVPELRQLPAEIERLATLVAETRAEYEREICPAAGAQAEG